MLARMRAHLLGAIALGLSFTLACTPAATTPPTTAPNGIATTTASAPPPFVPSPPLDTNALAGFLGVEKLELADGTAKASWPRTDVDVLVDGAKLPPFAGLTSWVALAPGRSGVAEAMIMGDLVLFEDEVNPAMTKLLDGGVQVTALHNHFFFAQPGVFFLHVGGEGKAEALARAVRSALDEVAAIRKRTPKPAATSGAPKLPEKSALEAAKLDATLGAKGATKDGMYKAVWGRDVTASCGCPAGKALGVTSWSAFVGTEDDAMVDGDFALAESELQAVLKALRAGGIDVVAIHHHMSGETPRLLFVHYWGRGKASALAATVRRALDLTAWSGKPVSP